ncbi:MAG: 23S rRNA (adenine(1618)-N(6))-methyltransferase RlmF [Colwellia sp.]
MQKEKNTKSDLNKRQLHPRNCHNKGYPFQELIAVSSELEKHLIVNQFNQQSTIDFSDAKSVKALNLALLRHYYQIKNWDIPATYLCPPIPGRVDYIHYLADLLQDEHIKSTPIKVLDIGTGASCIYPILGVQAYQWHFVASDIDPISIKFANKNILATPGLSDKISCRLQKNKNQIFKGIIQPDEFYHLTMCNPPFHKSSLDANKGSNRKWQNLDKNKSKANRFKQRDSNKDYSSKVEKANLNFGGQKAELWCEGGEVTFIKTMIKESVLFKTQVRWFTCLVSKKDNLQEIKRHLKKSKITNIKVINMAQGQKISRFIAWSF